MRFERILVPIDFSDPSERALEQAASLTVSMGTSMTALHVFEPVTTPTVDPAFRPAEGEDEQSKLVANLLGQLQRWVAQRVEPFDLSPDRVELRVELGSPVDHITNASGDHDLVVIATHGRTGLGRFLLGSVTERVVRGASCSTLVVHERDASNA